MTLMQNIFTAIVFLRPRSSNDEPTAAFPRIYRYIVDTWLWRPLAPLISLMVVASLTLHLVKMATERRGSTSVGGWMKTMFPSQRPERGGTSRGQGYWEQMENEGKIRPRRRMTDSQYSVGDVSADSGHIARWNVPKDLSEGQPHALPQQQKQQQQQGVIPTSSKAPSPPNDVKADKSWSWSPQNGSEDQISVANVGGVLQSNYDKSNGLSTSDMDLNTSNAGASAGIVAEKRHPPRRDPRARVKARRRERQSLRESSDYLGVQGVNPHTGELDIMSPSDSSAGSSASHQETQNSVMNTLRDIWRNSKHLKSKNSPGTVEHTTDDDHSISQRLKGKKKARELAKGVRWKRRAGQWSSLQEPDLSPITQSLKSASPSSRRPSHVQHPPQAIQQPASIFAEESLPEVALPHANSISMKIPDNHNFVSAPHATLPARSSSNSTGESGESDPGASYSQSNFRPTDEHENRPFLGVSAERDVNKPCVETIQTTLSATQSTQSILAFGQKSQRRFSPTGIMSMPPLSPDLRPVVAREPSPSMLLEESPLEAKSQLQLKKDSQRTEQNRWKRHRRPKDQRTREMKVVNGLKEVLPDIQKVQTLSGSLQEVSVTMELPASSRLRHQRLTKMETEQDLLELEENLTKSDKQQLEMHWHSCDQIGTEHEQASTMLCKITDRACEMKEPVYTSTIITTGFSHQTSPSASHVKSIGPSRLLPSTEAQQDESNYGVRAVNSSMNSLGSPHSNPFMSSEQSPTSSVEVKSAGELRAGTTCLEHEAHKRQQAESRRRDKLSVTAALLAPESSLLRKSTFILEGTLRAANQLKKLSTASQERRHLTPEMAPDLVDHQMHLHSLPEQHQIRPKHKDEDDTKKISSEEDRKLERAEAVIKGSEDQDDDGLEEEEEPTELRQFVRYLKAWIKLYWATVWPMLDPRTLRVEHEGPMPLWKACLLIILTAPAVALGFGMAIEAMKFITFLAWLFK
ncbi:hypothetical protein V8C35DRAFT_327639 [Trichoderma chlorosporum]